jgi:ABC-type microcin C transport system permease subunit YejB
MFCSTNSAPANTSSQTYFLFCDLKGSCGYQEKDVRRLLSQHLPAVASCGVAKIAQYHLVSIPTLMAMLAIHGARICYRKQSVCAPFYLPDAEILSA